MERQVCQEIRATLAQRPECSQHRLSTKVLQALRRARGTPLPTRPAASSSSGASPRPGDTRHLLWLRERLADAVVITTGRHAYRDEDDVAVVPAALLGP